MKERFETMLPVLYFKAKKQNCLDKYEMNFLYASFNKITYFKRIIE